MGQGIISRSNPGNSGDKVGDIKITTRNTLGEKWALCNGDNIPEGADYVSSLAPDLSKNESNNWKSYPDTCTGYIAKEYYASESNVYCAYLFVGEITKDNDYSDRYKPIRVTIDRFINGNPNNCVRILDNLMIGSEILDYNGSSLYGEYFPYNGIEHGSCMCFGMDETNNRAVIGYKCITAHAAEDYSFHVGSLSDFVVNGINITNHSISSCINYFTGIENLNSTIQAVGGDISDCIFKYKASGTTLTYVVAFRYDAPSGCGLDAMSHEYAESRSYVWRDEFIDDKMQLFTDYKYNTDGNAYITFTNYSFDRTVFPLGDSGTIFSLFDLENMNGGYAIYSPDSYSSALVDYKEGMLPISSEVHGADLYNIVDCFVTIGDTLYSFVVYDDTSNEAQIYLLTEDFSDAETTLSINKISLYSTYLDFDASCCNSYTYTIRASSSGPNNILFAKYSPSQNLWPIITQIDNIVYFSIEGNDVQGIKIFNDSSIDNVIADMSCQLEVSDVTVCSSGVLSSSNSYYDYLKHKYYASNSLPTISVDDESYCFIKIKD